MIDFEYYNPAKIVFGEHSEQKLKSLLASFGVKSLQLVYSGDFIKTLGIYDAIKDAVNELGIRFSENGNVVPNPSIDLVRELVKQGKENGVDFVLAVGGGSSIDTAKAYLTREMCGISLKRESHRNRYCRLVSSPRRHRAVPKHPMRQSFRVVNGSSVLKMTGSFRSSPS